MPTAERVGLPNAVRATTSGGRYAFIDILRGVAALLVIFQHGGEGAGWFSITTGFGRRSDIFSCQWICHSTES
ncbi:hypothetical protein B0G81_5970 [Paraburkholderia sp. BL6665CI2N2]|uniref:hypothetical protein n=1 Tax=Paraburkholderia sp. BL6665CI2N2 TaxID=1938806 RepID=UPI001066D259|nr:hypothetical protein [Paraburkholderia sp. BL6665CI2N2]TDY25497.1 hypothetical protein B0G81_5970 [Paraburkholderia sp. BL6665CI2N2]